MASKINKGEILAKFFDDGEYTALFADGAVSAACGYAAGQQAYAVYQNGEAVTVKDVEKNIKVLEMAAQTGCPVVTFYNSVGAKLRRYQRSERCQRRRLHHGRGRRAVLHRSVYLCCQGR